MSKMSDGGALPEDPEKLYAEVLARAHANPEDPEKFLAEVVERFGAVTEAAKEGLTRVQAVSRFTEKIARVLPERTMPETEAILRGAGTPEEKLTQLQGMFRNALREMQDDQQQPLEYREAAAMLAERIEEKVGETVEGIGSLVGPFGLPPARATTVRTGLAKLESRSGTPTGRMARWTPSQTHHRDRLGRTRNNGHLPARLPVTREHSDHCPWPSGGPPHTQHFRH